MISYKNYWSDTTHFASKGLPVFRPIAQATLATPGARLITGKIEKKGLGQFLIENL